MNIKQIQGASGQGGSKGNSPAHKNSGHQIAVKTVINRACNLLISSSDDSILYDPLEENDYVDTTKGKVEQEISSNANNESIGFDTIEEAEVVDENELRNNNQEMAFQENGQMEMSGPNF